MCISWGLANLGLVHNLGSDCTSDCYVLHVSYGEGDGTPLQYSFLENPMDGGAWWVALSGVTQSRRRLKRFSSGSSMCLTWDLGWKASSNPGYVFSWWWQSITRTRKIKILGNNTSTQQGCESITLPWSDEFGPITQPIMAMPVIVWEEIWGRYKNKNNLH